MRVAQAVTLERQAMLEMPEAEAREEHEVRVLRAAVQEGRGVMEQVLAFQAILHLGRYSQDRLGHLVVPAEAGLELPTMELLQYISLTSVKIQPLVFEWEGILEGVALLRITVFLYLQILPNQVRSNPTLWHPDPDPGDSQLIKQEVMVVLPLITTPILRSKDLLQVLQ